MKQASAREEAKEMLLTVGEGPDLAIVKKFQMRGVADAQPGFVNIDPKPDDLGLGDQGLQYILHDAAFLSFRRVWRDLQGRARLG
jgi:hypothetical protein